MQPTVTTGSGPNLRGEQRQRLAATLAERFRREGTPIRELAASINRRPTIVRRLLDEAGIQTEGPDLVGVSEPQTAAALATRYRQGSSIAALARETGIDWRVVRRLLVEAGVEMPTRGTKPAAPTAELVKRYQAGASIRSLATLTHTSYRVVRTTLLAAGITLRRPGQRSRSHRAD